MSEEHKALFDIDDVAKQFEGVSPKNEEELVGVMLQHPIKVCKENNITEYKVTNIAKGNNKFVFTMWGMKDGKPTTFDVTVEVEPRKGSYPPSRFQRARFTGDESPQERSRRLLETTGYSWESPLDTAAPLNGYTQFGFGTRR